MQLGGTLSYGGAEYFVALNQSKSSTTWHIISPLHPDDATTRYTGLRPTNDVLTLAYLTTKAPDKAYIRESMKRKNLSTSSEVYMGRMVILEIIEAITSALSYRFADSDVKTNITSTHMGLVYKKYDAADSRIVFSYEKQDNLWSKLRIRHGQIDLTISADYRFKLPKLPYTTVSDKKTFKAVPDSVATLDYESLKKHPDLNLEQWYEKDGVYFKNYIAIENEEDFETLVIDDLVREANEAEAKGVRLVVAMDSETDGLLFRNLKPENEDRNTLVAIPLSWKDDFAVVIFVGMLFLDNVDVNYVLDRLRGFFGKHMGQITIEKRFKSIKETTTVSSMNSFGSNEQSEVEITPPATESKVSVGEYYRFQRETIQLIGHNSLFDALVFKAYGMDTLWQDDTLQMAFNLNPKVGKGLNKLKSLTRRIWGIEAPELSDILGKGNEDKFKFITDKRVAVLYGGADADFTRLCYRYLEALTPPRMLAVYRKRDMASINNFIVEMDYYGMNTNYEGMLQAAKVVALDMEVLREFIYKIVGMTVDRDNKINDVLLRQKAGLLSEKDVPKELEKIKIEKDAIYTFDLGGNDVRHVLYTLLRYPIVAWTKGKDPKPSVDKYAIEKLMNRKSSNPPIFKLTSDIMSASGSPDDVLVDKKKYNSSAYPVAYLLKIYAGLNKDYTSYFMPMIQENHEGKIFKNTSLARIETRRIMNAGQTIKKSMKKNIIAYSDMHYLFDFDQSQVEYRIMVSIAEFILMIEKLQDPENDYHIETAATVFEMLAHEVTRAIRGDVKGLSFGIPYGLGPEKMTRNLNKGEYSRELLYRTLGLLHKYKSKNKPIIDMLEKYRKMPLTPVNFDEFLQEATLKLDVGNLPVETRKLFTGRTVGEEFRRFIRPSLDADNRDTPYGMVRGVGNSPFYRLFDLSNMDRAKQGKIERPAGNYPIQNFAAELFRTILNAFHDNLVKYGIRDKVIFHMLIHDECLGSAHLDIHPFLLYKIIYESCVVTMQGHTTYFVGINMGHTWYECKDDKSEAPMEFVKRIIQRWDAGEFLNDTSYRDDPKEYIAKYKHDYIVQRIYEVVSGYQPDIDSSYIDYVKILEKFDKYTVRSYISDYFKPNIFATQEELKKIEESDSNRLYLLKFESWVIEKFGEGKELLYPDGMLRKVYKSTIATDTTQGALPDLDFEDEDEDNGFWSFEDPEGVDGDISGSYFDYEVLMEDEDEEFNSWFNEDVEDGKTLADFLVKPTYEYKKLRCYGNTVAINVDLPYMEESIKKYLLPQVTANGNKQVIFKTPVAANVWKKVKDIDLRALDEFVVKVHGGK